LVFVGLIENFEQSFDNYLIIPTENGSGVYKDLVVLYSGKNRSVVLAKLVGK